MNKKGKFWSQWAAAIRKKPVAAAWIHSITQNRPLLNMAFAYYILDSHEKFGDFLLADICFQKDSNRRVIVRRTGWLQDK